MKKIPISKARAMFSNLPDLLEQEGQPITITVNGVDKMVAMPWKAYEDILNKLKLTPVITNPDRENIVIDVPYTATRINWNGDLFSGIVHGSKDGKYTLCNILINNTFALIPNENSSSINCKSCISRYKQYNSEDSKI